MAQTGPGRFVVDLGGQRVAVTSDLPLVAGTSLRLQLVSVQGGRWTYQTVPPAPGAGPTSAPGSFPGLGPDPLGLAAAFLGRGLAAVPERLGPWTRWLAGRSGPLDRAAWAADLEGRSWAPGSDLAARTEPWLAWQADLEAGRSPPPPDDDEVWDLWNLRQPRGADPWLVLPLRWELDGQADAGLLRARWHAPAQAVDRWTLTAAPAGVGQTLEAQVRPGALDLTWRFFDAEAARGLTDAQPWEALLSRPDLRVSLRILGPGEAAP